MKILFRIIIEAVIILFLIRLTTFGWRPSRLSTAALSEPEKRSAKNIEHIVRHLSQTIGTRSYTAYGNLEKSAAFIAASFRELGYSVEIMPYEVNGRTFKNIIAQTPGRNANEDFIIIGAHYDTCFNPGADDNASGVAGLIELARLLRDAKLSHNLKFIAFTNEEPPFFQTNAMGSLVYVKGIPSAGEKIKAAVILEMIGYFSEKPFSQRYLPLLGPFYPNKANFITIVGNFASKDLVNVLYDGFQASSNFPVERLVAPGFIPGINFSDHWSFWEAGIPAVMITDTAYLRNNHYHQKTDLPETLNYEKMTQVVYGFKNAVAELIKQGHIP